MFLHAATRYQVPFLKRMLGSCSERYPAWLSGWWLGSERTLA